MSIENQEIPVAQMECGPTPETKYAIAPDGTVVETEAVQENPESFQEQMQ